jgi:hypothetical protein
LEGESPALKRELSLREEGNLRGKKSKACLPRVSESNQHSSLRNGNGGEFFSESGRREIKKERSRFKENARVL